jgi:hypothetical protein
MPQPGHRLQSDVNFLELPFRVLVIQTDNAEFQSRFHWHLDHVTSAAFTSDPGHRI